MPGGFENDALKVLRFYVSVSVFVEDVECLPYPLALQASKHLRELGICQIMAVFLSSVVQRCPFAIPVERYGVGAFIQVVQLLEIVIFYSPRTFLIEQAKCNLVLCIWLGQKIFEGGPISKRYSSGLSPVSDLEENRVLFSLNFVLLTYNR